MLESVSPIKTLQEMKIFFSYCRPYPATDTIKGISLQSQEISPETKPEYLNFPLKQHKDSTEKGDVSLQL